MVMADTWIRIAGDLGDRISGPMSLRLILQPIMASIFAVVSGLKDAKTGKPPYFWTLLTVPAHRADMIKDGWRSAGKVFILALILDIAYQIAVLQFVFPGEALIVAFLLAIVPYVVLRVIVTRLAI